MNIWNLTGLDVSEDGSIGAVASVRLWKRSETEYLVIEAGAYTPFLTAPAYTLVQRAFAPAFEDLDEPILLSPVTIADAALGTATAIMCRLLLRRS